MFKMSDMHETMERLYKVAKNKEDIDGQTALAKRLNQSPQTLNNWEDRGMSKAGILLAGKEFGINANWLETGEDDVILFSRSAQKHRLGAMIDVDDDYKNFARVVGTADMGNRGYYLDLDGGDGYLDFECEEGAIAIHVRGHSMFPAIRDGWFVIIEPSNQLTIGEYVLLKFKDGKNMVKELLQTKEDCYVVMSVNGNDRITAMKQDLHGIEAISAVVPPSKHKQW